MNPRFRKARIATLMTSFLFSSAALAFGPIEVSLTGGEEVPPVQSAAKGTGKIEVRDDKSVRGTVKTSNMKVTMAHIHQGAKGENGPAIIHLRQSASSPDEWTVPTGSKLTANQYQSLKTVSFTSMCTAMRTKMERSAHS